VTYRLRDVALFLGGELVGDGGAPISGINGVKEAKAGELAFVFDVKYESYIESSAAAGVVVPRQIKGVFNKPVIKVDDPAKAMAKIIKFASLDKIPHPRGIHQNAVISKKAKIGRGVAVGAFAVIEEGADIGDNTVIYPLCYIGKGARIGKDCIFYPSVTVREEIVIGERVIVHPGSVIGADGFGYVPQKDGTHMKIPQLGTVVIEDDVEIGACSTVDRARFDKTVVGKGTKIDNLVQIAHNVRIGPNCIIAAQTGISGSTELGHNVILGGQVGVADNLKLGDNVMAGAKTGISKSFPQANTVLFWYPAKPVDKARETIASIGLLPKLFARVRELEAKVKELEAKR
jgi:UDP-3-O-[3-hydroxymyristoyl] glucosamine N-acyltransferase